MGTLLNGSEQKFFDNVALEVLTLAGTPDPVLWKFFSVLPSTPISSVSGQIDCIYSDPVSGSKHYLAYSKGLMCYFEKPDSLFDATDQGLTEKNEGRMWLARKNLEALKVPLDVEGDHVTAGDIIQLWSKNKIRTWYFEVVQVEREGFENDSDVFTHYACNVVRNHNFKPERKIVL